MAWILSNDILIPKATDAYPTGLYVLAQFPYPGEELLMDGSIEVYFNPPVDSIQRGKRAAHLAIACRCSGVARRSQLAHHASPWQAAARHDPQSLNQYAHSTDNLCLAEPSVLQFETPGYLEVIEVVLASNTKDIDANAVIMVFFNWLVTPLVIVEEMGTLPNSIGIKLSLWRKASASLFAGSLFRIIPLITWEVLLP